jgi:hypothetical protein
MRIHRYFKPLASVVSFVTLTAGLWLFGVVPCCAQQIQATVYGAVTDPGGAPIPEATVTVTNPATGQSVIAKTGLDGNYIVPSLRPSTYELRVEYPGFQVSIQKGIKLDVNQQARIDFQLKVGAVTTSVEVAGLAPQVETATATVGMMIDTRQVTELPLNIRRFGTLPLLMPGTVADRGGFSSFVGGSPFSENTYAANGARGSGNNTLIDGVDAKDLFSGGFSVQPSPDAVQEFKVQTESFSAVFGKSAGSTINLVTKSGTNEIHGTAFEFLRNRNLDSRNFFDQNQLDVSGNEIPGTARGQLQRNQFGGYIGGPIKKNKTFFFGGYEGLRLRKGNNYVDTVPTPQMLQGDFSQLYTGQTFSPCVNPSGSDPVWDTGQIFDPGSIHSIVCGDGSTTSVANAFTGNLIPQNMFDPVAKKVISLNAFPAPNVPGAIYSNYVTDPPDKRRDNQFLVKIDHEFSVKDKFFGRYIFAQSNIVTPTTAYSTLPGFENTVRFRGQNLALSWTHTISPNMLNEVRLGFSRNVNNGDCEGCPKPPGFVESFGIPGLKALSPQLEGFPGFTFANNYSTVGDSGYRPSASPDMVEKYNDTVTLIKGKHTLAFGVDIEPYQSLGNEGAISPDGQFGYNGLYSNSPIADFLLGYPNSFARTVTASFLNHDGKFWNAFIQEDWRASSKLTINAGLRWEYHELPTDRHNVGAVLFPIPGAGLLHPGNALMVLPSYQRADEYCNNPFYTNAEGQRLIACSSDMKRYGFTGRTARSLAFADHFNWAPRLGFAYRPTKSDRLVIRSGFGLFFDVSEFNVFHYGDGNPIDGATFSEILNQAQIPSGNFAAPEVTTATAFTGLTLPTLANSYMSMNVDPNFRQPYIYEWDFEIDSQLTQNMALSVRYLGTDAFQMSHFHDFGNQAVPGPGDIQARRIYPDFGYTALSSSGASANYNSLQVQLIKKMAQGFNLTAGYTYSKSLANNEGEEGAGADSWAGLAQNDNGLGAEYARDINDTRHRLTFSAVADLPFGRGRRFAGGMGRVPNAFLGGWEMSGIFSAQTGFPETPQSGQDFANVGTGSWRPDRLCDGDISNRSINHWFNDACFTTALLSADQNNGVYRFGNTSRSAITGPGMVNIDFGLMKNFQMGERWKGQFRAEFFNALNHANFGDPHMNMTDGSYNTITSAGQPRDIQFGLKFTF